VDLTVGNIGNVGVIVDPAGVEFWGLTFTLNVLEYSQ